MNANVILESTFLKIVFIVIGIITHPININMMYNGFRLTIIRLSNITCIIQIIKVLLVPNFFEYKINKNTVNWKLG